ncbi:Putative LuxR-family transcriptional regulator [Minicystis rosea]|nr:Putative LuxR-family transcriptional regulator [Minicystis rosea]
MDELWKRVRAGRHTAVLGASPGEPPAASGVRVVRVRCDVPPTTLGPLHEARRKVEHLLGGSAPLFEEARDRMVQGLRRRLLGDVPALDIESSVVEALNRLAGASDRPSAVLFDAVDAADDATLSMLRRIVGRPGWLKLPVVLAFRTTDPTGAAAALLATLESAAGSGSVMRVEDAAHATAGPASTAFRGLPSDVLRVLRAGAIVGSGFEADLVAELLGLELLDVLDVLQRAADAGVPVEDLGEGRFHLPEPMLDALRASMLPSLMIAWHQRVAELLGGFDAYGPGFEPESGDRDSMPPAWTAEPGEGLVPTRRAQEGGEISLPPAKEEPSVAPPKRVSDVPATERRGSVTSRASSEARPTVVHASIAPPSPGPWPYADIFPPASQTPAPHAASPSPKGVWEAPSVSITDAGAPSIRPRAAAPSRRSAPPPASAARGDDARAAGHLAAAGDLDASAERYRAAAQKAAELGAHSQALGFADKALAILDALPAAPRRRRLRARVLLDLGRLKWQAMSPASAPGFEPAFTLAGALETLEAARATLAEDDPPELAAEIATAVAGVCYDLGEPSSLARALDELTAASRLLLDAGDPTGAARLLNDQAAVHVRLGDPVRATHLLTESRKIFEERAATDPVAAVEVAETDHLFARIPLHVPARPGREADALTMGLDHALAAERVYQRLDARRELARVWETMGRLELRKGRLDRARDRLTAAVEAEEAIGDLVGLARSTAALSELLAAGGHLDDALAVLSDSVTLNFEKGSPIGLAFNRRALDALDRAPGAGRSSTRALLDETRARLEAAESVLGRLSLPGEKD